MKSDRIFKDQLFNRVSEIYPQNTLDLAVIDFDGLTQLYNSASTELVTTHGVKEEREWSAYGCGFASFVESWFYCEKPEFEFKFEGMDGKGYNGVCILFCLLEPMFAAGEAHKTWGEHGGGGMLPSLGMIDEYSSKPVEILSARICRHLKASGIPQVSKRTLEEPIRSDIAIESNMKEGNLKLFDAFYQWMD